MVSRSQPRYLGIARAIEAEIRSRHSGAKVPSARNIALVHKVSLVTASRAIQVLHDKGLIQTVGRSGSFVVGQSQSVTGTECFALVLRSTPGPWLQISTSFSQAGFTRVEREEGVRFETDRFHFDEATRPADLLRQVRRAAVAGISGVVFMPSRHEPEAAAQDEAFARACRETRLPLVLIERNLRGLARALEYDLIAADDLDGGLRCTRHLLDQGRRRVAFVAGSPTSSHEGRLAGYLTALHHAKANCGPLILEQPLGIASKDSYKELAGQLLLHGADGVVCYQDYTALGLILELLNQGVRVPSDVAVTGFDNLPIGKAYSIGVTTYAFSSEMVARHATWLLRARLRDMSRPPVRLLIPGDLIIRESSGPA